MQADALQVIIVTPGFPANENETENIPGLQEYVLGLARMIGTDNIKIVCTQYPKHNTPYVWHGIVVFPCGIKALRLVQFFITMKRSVSRIRSLITSNSVIHSFWLTDASLAAQQAMGRSNLPWVATCMGQDVKPKNRYLRFLKLSRCKTVALSDFQKEELKRSVQDKVSAVIPFFITPPSLPVISKRDIDILFVASFISLKQPQQFIEIINELRLKHPELKAVMIGQGPLLEAMRVYIHEKGLQSAIELTGALPREKVFEWMSRSRILLHTSVYEGQCLAYMEALASGMHVVSYRTGRIEHTARHMVCDNKMEMIDVTDKLLEQNLSYEPYLAGSVFDTVKQYMQLYTGSI